MTDVHSESDLRQLGLPVVGARDLLRLIWAVDHALQRRSGSVATALGITRP
jgi:hypothetical protein